MPIVKITFLVSPGRKHEKLEMTIAGPKVFLKAPPVDGKANQGLLQFVAKLLRIPPSRMELVAGHTARVKTIAIDTDVSKDELMQLLQVAASS